MNKLVKLSLVCLLLLGVANYGLAQTNVEVFGKNRVQYKRFDWKYYNAEHFKIYHYDRSGQGLARYVAEQAEQDISAIERRLGGLFPDKLDIILYNTFDDFDQSNIGLNSDMQITNYNPAGTVTLVGDKLVIYFTGTHSDLKRQLRQGMAQVVMERLIFGENFREMVRNALFLNLPRWVTAGYIDYVVDGWTPDDDSHWKNALMGQQKVFFDELGERNPELAGKAFWKYISVKHGENNVKNLLYLTQLKSNLNKALKLTINQKLKATYDSVVVFYQDRYHFEEQVFEPFDSTNLLTTIKVPRNEGRIKDILVSPRGGDVAFVKWLHGEYEVILQKTQVVNGVSKKMESVLFNGGVKDYTYLQDPDYPLLSWSNTGFKLGIIFKVGDKVRLRVYDAIKGKIQDFKIPPARFDRITGFTFMEDDDMIILSAIKKGQSDLFEYRMKRSRMTQLTDDEWDDAAPVFVSGGARKGVLFLSNRPLPYINIKPLPNELPTGTMNAFFYNSTTQSTDLMQLTKVKKGTVTQAIPYGSDHFAYLCDVNGVRNRFVVMFGRDARNMDTAYSVPITNFSRNILYQQYNPASGKVADVIQWNDQYRIYFNKIELPAPDGNGKERKLLPLSFVDGVAGNTKSTVKSAMSISQMDKDGGSDIGKNDFKIQTGNTFQSEFNAQRRADGSGNTEPDGESVGLAEMLSLKSPADTNIVAGKQDKTAAGNTTVLQDTIAANGKRIVYVDSSFIALRSQKYYLSFKPEFFSLRVDNSVIFNRYQPYGSTGGNFTNPSLAGMLMAKLTDKMEDYRFTGGVRVPINFSGSTYLVQFENFRRRVDWGVLLLRQENRYSYNVLYNQEFFVVPAKNATNIVQGTAIYPFDKVKSVRFHFGFRQDRLFMRAANPIGLILPNSNQYWAQSRAEYVYDNTRNPVINIWEGARVKLFGEYMYKFRSDNAYQVGPDTFMDQNLLGGFYNIGMDMRFYKKIYKNFTAAVRLAGAHSGGNQKIVYFLGGVDNSLNANFSNALQASGRNNYAFQALATNLRGYDQNARNGNTFAVMNAELRLPILPTLLRRPVQSSILKNLQLVSFVDIGSAWEGLLPNGEAFDRNYRINSGNITVIVPNYGDNGIAIGVGSGLRTTLFGYFLRADVATNLRKDVMWHLSIGTDF